MQKIVIINRGIPASGKSTLANYIKLQGINISVDIHSTDSFFMKSDRYIFEIDKLAQYHKQNLENFRKSILNDRDIIICDNTNIEPWEAKPYYEIAKDFGYKVVLITFKPRDIKDISRDNSKNIPQDIINDMMKKYYSIDSIQQSLISDTIIEVDNIKNELDDITKQIIGR